ncbi:hypothetical protein [Brevibacterium jeotgali]|uniref:Putative flavoprotein involved in K+ transport n=1 Tax=Brevibacterium jeotgali TaxID=1262550 RepID=A0A2H1L8S3_9MICO|nr:hypothetical protein [Brevibacterium jeotgali]SMY13150.1 putative flavoprotein involved in K+ transport [Brevibacterium jeotgali]
MIAGRDLFWWLTTTGVLDASHTSRLGRRVRGAEPVIGSTRRGLRNAGVTFHPRAVNAQGRSITFADSSTLDFDTVIWATGYRHRDRWITLPGALDSSGALITTDGVTPVPGLYSIGRSWQQDRGSALLGFVARDAHRLARRAMHSLSKPAPGFHGRSSPPAEEV